MSESAFTLPSGARDDLATGESLSDLQPFFAAVGAARRFVALAVEPWLAPLAEPGQPVACVDIGGGEGIVAQALSDLAKLRRIPCNILVLDHNPRFLAAAAARGLATWLGEAADLPAGSADCVVLRFVNHYNSATEQARLAASLARLVRPGGLLAAQIETGDPATCALMEEIAALASGDQTGAGRHWPTLLAFEAAYRAVGFAIEVVYGADVEDRAPSAERLEEAWTRLRGPALEAALKAGDIARAAAVLDARDDFLHAARTALARAGAGGTVATTQPIIVMRRRSAQPADGREREGTDP